MYRLGVLGCSSIAKKSMVQNFIDSKQFNVNYFASRDLSKAKAYSDIFGGTPIGNYESLINKKDIDCIYISLPTGLHYEYGKKSLEAGKHIFVEKSFCENYEQTAELVEIAESKGLTVFENFMFLENDQYAKVRELLADKDLGNVNLLRSSFCFPIFEPETNIRYKNNLGGGALLDAGAYVIKGADFILREPLEVTSSLLIYSEKYKVDFHGYLTMKTINDIIVQSYFGFDDEYHNEIEIYLSNGYIKIERAYTSPPNFEHKIIIKTGNCEEEIVVNSTNPGVSHCERFADMITNKLDQFQYNKSLLSQSRIIDIIKNESNHING